MPSGFGPSSATRRPGCTRRSRKGKRLLFEGAQGSLLDIDHGSYPYVTSSNSSAAGIAAGSGVPTRHIDRWIGVVKAYTTRVGGGPVPHRAGQRDRRADPPGGPRVRDGHRPAPAVRLVRRRRRPLLGAGQRRDRAGDHAPGRAQRDRRAEGRGRLRDGRPAGHRAARLAGRFRPLPAGLRDVARLVGRPDRRPPVVGPAARARNYVEFLAEQVGVPASIVSVGPDRRQTILVPDRSSR